MSREITSREILIDKIKSEFGDFLVTMNFDERDSFYSHSIFSDITRARNEVLRETNYWNKGEGVEVEEPQLPEYIGFEEDEDLDDFPQLIKRMFSERILKAARISKITNRTEVVDLMLDQTNQYFLPLAEYEKMKKMFPQVIDIRTRAENLASLNPDHKISTPIFVYSFIDESTDKFNYLRDVPDDIKMKAYKIGTINHEIAHHIYLHVLTDGQKQKWQRVLEVIGSLTSYSQKYINGTHDQGMRFDEEFSEAVRLRTTTPNYLRNEFEDVWNFFEEELPDIQSFN